MASNATNVSARRAKAIALIQSGVIHSQSDLVAALKKTAIASPKQQRVEI